MLTEQDTTELQKLQAAFLEQNAQLNLSALRTEDACWHGNVLDSIAAIEAIKKYSEPGAKIADIGTGGGFPLLPLALLSPDRTWIGIDSVQKKIAAIERICAESFLTNVQLYAGRLEDLGREKKHREQYDIVTSRAVAPMATLLEFMAPLVKVGGHLICWKSMHIEQELQASLDARGTLHCHLIETIPYTLPGDWGKRQLLVFKKTNPLSNLYPRQVGLPKKQPL